MINNKENISILYKCFREREAMSETNLGFRFEEGRLVREGNSEEVVFHWRIQRWEWGSHTNKQGESILNR